MFKFSKTSLERLETCHRDLQTVMLVALAQSDIDFGIACGYRSVEDQQKAYREKRSQLDGVTRKSKHNSTPSMAVDIYAWVNGRANWNDKNLSYLAGVIMSTAKRLHDSRRIKHKLRWGGNWNKWDYACNYDGFVDMPHFELI